MHQVRGPMSSRPHPEGDGDRLFRNQLSLGGAHLLAMNLCFALLGHDARETSALKAKLLHHGNASRVARTQPRGRMPHRVGGIGVSDLVVAIGTSAGAHELVGIRGGAGHGKWAVGHLRRGVDGGRAASDPPPQQAPSQQDQARQQHSLLWQWLHPAGSSPQDE